MRSAVQRHQSAVRPILRQISSLMYPKIQRRQVIMNVLHPAWLCAARLPGGRLQFSGKYIIQRGALQTPPQRLLRRLLVYRRPPSPGRRRNQYDAVGSLDRWLVHDDTAAWENVTSLHKRKYMAYRSAAVGRPSRGHCR